MSADGRAAELVNRFFVAEEAAQLLNDLDAVDKAAGIYRVSLDAAIEAAAEQDCEDWENCTVREVHRGWARKALTAAVMGGAQ